MKLGAGLLRIGLGVWLTGGLDEGRELMDGLEGIDGAGVGRLKDGLGRLNDGLGWLDDGFGRLKDGLGRLDDGLGLLENDLCWKLDARPAIGLLRLAARVPDLSRPSSRLPAIGEINVAATTAATAARDLIIFLVNILLLLGPPNVTAASAAHMPAAITQPPPRIQLVPLIILLFSRL